MSPSRRRAAWRGARLGIPRPSHAPPRPVAPAPTAHYPGGAMGTSRPTAITHVQFSHHAPRTPRAALPVVAHRHGAGRVAHRAPFPAYKEVFNCIFPFLKAAFQEEKSLFQLSACRKISLFDRVRTTRNETHIVSGTERWPSGRRRSTGNAVYS